MNISEFPIFIVDAGGGDLSPYGSVADAELQLETIDLRNGCYVGYDAEGRLLRLEAAAEKASIAKASVNSIMLSNVFRRCQQNGNAIGTGSQRLR